MDIVARSPPQQTLNVGGVAINRLQYYHVKVEIFYEGDVRVNEAYTKCDDVVAEVCHSIYVCLDM